MTCYICGKEVVSTRYTRNRYKTMGRVYCSKECSNKFRAARSSATMAETNRKYASKRMKIHNPMFNLESKEKARKSLIAIGHKPVQRGGNGNITSQQKKLASALGFPMEIAICTKRILNSPNCYKVDIACPDKRLAIEVDGNSHNSTMGRERDRKKEQVLSILGWKVIRFWNEEIDNDLLGCVSKVKEELGMMA